LSSAVRGYYERGTSESTVGWLERQSAEATRGYAMKPLTFKTVLIAVTVFQSWSWCNDLREADSLYRIGDAEHIGASIKRYARALAQSPNDYNVLWKYSRACRDFGDLAKMSLRDGWKKTCAEYGKRAMSLAEKAIEIDPSRVEAHFQYGLAVGTYSDGVSILTALKEGLKDKTQKSLERAVRIDKTHNDAGPCLALGRFWAVVPWPFKNTKKALRCYREYLSLSSREIQKHERLLYVGELLVELGEANYAEARKHLRTAEKSEKPFIRQRATELLARIGP